MTEQLFTLPVQKQLSPAVSQCQIADLPVLIVTHPKGRAAITLQGAHLVSWQPAGQKPVIWLSRETAFTPGVAIRGGVPICWPWFGPAGKPSHGFARNLPWQLTAQSEDDEKVQLTLTLKDSAETRQHWPHDFTLHAHFTFGDECTIELESHGDFETTSALHAYFEIGDITKVSVEGLGQPYLDKVLGGEKAVLQGPLTFDGEVDRIFTEPATESLIVDPVLNRTLSVRHQGNSDVVSWNPGPVLSASMKDMADDGYQTMVCVETAAVMHSQISTQTAPARLAVRFGVK
ncbi:D-hexose-6-phosphate mutarotase [Rouxiella chamberiensis]|uniref:Putative glucose-6-phosphate 1-epimerase n=1 Tax=Rouxiella chamberiensis TaxID=1513468 RepID=A0ABY7HTJ3_9GAMM|nr:D-hexose-6-phosphate mutarotase [Rouxiella chamberiensis]WAT02131.1 D-hexose-6-phosphate mutarotase [Rouxiella chamberiensis]